MKEGEDKKYDVQFGVARLLFLLLHLAAILINLQDQTHNIFMHFPQIQSSQSHEFIEIGKSFKAASTMAFVFTVMQLIVLYVGTNRFRLKSTVYSNSLHIKPLLYTLSGCGCTWAAADGLSRVFGVMGFASFLPTVSQIAIALYTAKV